MRLNEFKSETVSSTLNSNKSPSCYNQPSSDIIKWPLFKSSEKYSHASQFTKHLYPMTHEGGTLIWIQKWLDAIIYAFFQYLSTNKIWSSYKSLRAEHHNIYCFILPLDTHTIFSKAKQNYKALSIALVVYIDKDKTISSSKSPKLHVKLITYMNNNNSFDLLLYFP